MGGRGASSGISNLMGKGERGGNRYGTQFKVIKDKDDNPLVAGNIKFVAKTEDNEETLMETMTSGRVYVIVDQGKPKSIVYFDSENKRSKQIDIDERHSPGAHVHRGYLHNEYSPNGRPTGLLHKERLMLERVLEIWENRMGKQ